jgi:hypothetical protein
MTSLDKSLLALWSSLTEEEKCEVLERIKATE